MSKDNLDNPVLGPDDYQFSLTNDVPNLEPWTEIAEGRFMPRRVRGSFHGRALG